MTKTTEKTGKALLEDLATQQQEKETQHLLGLDKPKVPEDAIIQKVKITKTDTLEVELVLNGGKLKWSPPERVHPDLKAAFDKLVKHFAILCDTKEFKKPAALWEDINFQNLQVLIVHVISIGGEGAGVTLSGKRQVGSKEYALSTPYTEYNSEVNGYDYSGLLKKAVDVCLEETILYLNGKCEDKTEDMKDLYHLISSSPETSQKEEYNP